MTEIKLKDIEILDMEDLLKKIGASFDIKFAQGELAYITTFGQLCAHIENKIELSHTDDCTTQQAFYKLRNAISATFSIERKSITTDFSLESLLPRQSRRSKIKELENHLDLDLNILRQPRWVTATLVFLLFGSLMGLFVDWRIGLAGVVLSVLGLWLAQITGNELDLETIGQVAKKMTRENYKKSRRDPAIFNKKEVEKILREWFSDELGLA